MAGMEADDISRVVFCGGTSKIPRLQKSVSNLLKKAELLSSLNSDEVIALGAASHSALVAEDPWEGTEISPVLNGNLKLKSGLNLMSRDVKKSRIKKAK